MLLASSQAFADPPKLKGIKPLKPVASAAATVTPAPTAAPTASAKPAPSATTPAPAATPAPTATAAPATSASAKPATSASAAAPAPASTTGVESLTGLKLAKLDDRLEALRVLTDQKKTTLPDRKKAEQERTRLRWGSVVDQPAVRTELADHSDRVARLERIRELGTVEAKPAVVDRATKALEKENVRHETKMGTLAAGGTK
jgi:transcription initiation factor TFIID subunit TAF12